MVQPKKRKKLNDQLAHEGREGVRHWRGKGIPGREEHVQSTRGQKKKKVQEVPQGKWLAGEHEWQGGGWRWEVVRSAGERWSRAKENTSRVLKREREDGNVQKSQCRTPKIPSYHRTLKITKTNTPILKARKLRLPCLKTKTRTFQIN